MDKSKAKSCTLTSTCYQGKEEKMFFIMFIQKKSTGTGHFQINKK